MTYLQWEDDENERTVDAQSTSVFPHSHHLPTVSGCLPGNSNYEKSEGLYDLSSHINRGYGVACYRMVTKNTVTKCFEKNVFQGKLHFFLEGKNSRFQKSGFLHIL